LTHRNIFFSSEIAYSLDNIQTSVSSQADDVLADNVSIGVEHFISDDPNT